MASDRVDIVIFGATGFTGQFVVRDLLSMLNDGKTDISFAVGGRNLKKMRNVVENMAAELEVNSHILEKVTYLVADVMDDESLRAMCARAKCVLNCVGPYRFFGEQVVRACVDTGAHHLDISGEPQFLETMQLEFDKLAKQKGVYIIGSCGFDSIPCDMGVTFLQQQANGEVNSVESFFELNTGPSGFVGHYATFQSAIYGFANAGQLSGLRCRLFPKRLPKPVHKLKPRGSAFFADEVNGWCVPFMGADKSVVARTQRYLHDNYSMRPAQLGVYAKVGTLTNLLKLMFYGFFFTMLSKFPLGRSLLEKYPSFFTNGLFNHEGPTRQQMAQTSFRMTFYGQSYDKSGDTSKIPQQNTIVTVEGPEPGYVATPICLLQSALTLLEEEGQLPSGGGVLTPGAAFGRTSLVRRLDEAGIRFSVMKNLPSVSF